MGRLLICMVVHSHFRESLETKNPNSAKRVQDTPSAFPNPSLAGIYGMVDILRHGAAHVCTGKYGSSRYGMTAFTRVVVVVVGNRNCSFKVLSVPVGWFLNKM
jgi:hypothetical protein